MRDSVALGTGRGGDGRGERSPLYLCTLMKPKIRFDVILNAVPWEGRRKGRQYEYDKVLRGGDIISGQ